MTDTVRILFVDDEVNILRALERAFIEDDYEILTATSGEEALRILEEGSSVQVVVSDFRMPGMNGVDLLSRVRGKWPEMVRAVLSGYADTAAIVSAINEGQIYRFIPKPWNDTDLRMTIAAAVEQHKRQAKEILFANILQQRINELEVENSFLVRRIAEAGPVPKACEILDALPAGVLVFNREGTLNLCNPEASCLLAGGEEAPVAHMSDPRVPGELRNLLEKSSPAGRNNVRISINGRDVLASVCRVEGAAAEAMTVVVLCPEGDNG